MDISEMKQTYYKRFGSGKNYLHFVWTGAQCPLLGHAEIKDAPLLNCSLSMGVGMLARRLDGITVKIRHTDSDRCFTYTPPSPPALYKAEERDMAEIINASGAKGERGAEILCQSAIPPFISGKTEFNLSLAKALDAVRSDSAGKNELALKAALSNPIAPYMAAAFAKSGYCTLVSQGIPKSYPLPLSGYKIITAYTAAKERGRGAKIHSAFLRIREKYPPVSSIADITPGHTVCVKNRTAADYMLHLAEENTIIKNAARGLLKCDISALFDAMNQSQKSMEKYWNLEHEHALMAHYAKGLDGVRAVRCFNGGIVAVTDEDYVDYAVNMIKRSFENNAGYQPTFCVTKAD